MSAVETEDYVHASGTFAGVDPPPAPVPPDGVVGQQGIRNFTRNGVGDYTLELEQRIGFREAEVRVVPGLNQLVVIGGQVDFGNTRLVLVRCYDPLGNPADCEIFSVQVLQIAIGPVGQLPNPAPVVPIGVTRPFADYWAPQSAILSTVNGLARANIVQRNQRNLITFNDSTDQNATFAGVMGDTYAGGAIQLDIDWVSVAVVDDVRFGGQWERLEPNGPDVDIDQFAAALFTTEPAEATTGEIVRTSIVFTNAQADGIAAGDTFRLLTLRDTSVANNMIGDAQMLSVSIREL